MRDLSGPVIPEPRNPKIRENRCAIFLLEPLIPGPWGGGGGGFSATEPVTSSVDEIEKFASLLERGFLTQDEFDAKKAQLLGLYRSV